VIQRTKQLLWRLLAVIGLLLALIGAVLPVMPTVPFLLLAAWAAGKGWPELEAWLLAHSVYGPSIRAWREHGAVPRKAKWLACSMMACSALLLWFVFPVPNWLRWGVYGTFLVVGLWLCTRPEPRQLSEKVPSQP